LWRFDELLGEITMSIKIADKKGRIALGAEFAGKTFIVLQEADHIILQPAVVLPECEAWLYENETALASVRRGVQQARKQAFSTSPSDLDADEELIADLDD
jgi:hypothetical protein